MLYYLFHYLDQLNVPGAGVIEYISFRAAMTVITSLVISMLFGKKIIRKLQRLQIGEEIRDLGLEGQMQKKGTPTMGGVIILLAIILPVLLWAKLDNTYVILMLATTIWLGGIGFIDDYIKVFKKNKKGLPGKFKIMGQVIIGLVIGLTLYFSDDVVIRVKSQTPATADQQIIGDDITISNCEEGDVLYHDIKSTRTSIPFVKDNEFNYVWFVNFLNENVKYKFAWGIFVVITVLIITLLSNGANLTDGLDGLAAGSAAVIGATLGVLAYVSGNHIAADYLNIMYIPNTGELVVYMAAFIGATIGFLWYNSFPAQVFMGDTGSLAIGGIIAVFAIIIKKELLLPILCGVFIMESLSVIMQVAYFKYTKRKYGEGRRIFLMSPLHHHYQKKGYPEAKIVARFWIVGLLLAVITIITLKLR
ncbi:MAG: phospho-N-acetylmuramoyl-pentapeptide-transferase [Bacteroidales bacterium]|nr:phospho-N-acetylmuramoyl-pentapeptide-transferase [Bacteroidales bacterium]HOY37864.1 phospho-N-acetylmuramoyl-pentapeptide-transferase [Bacteroidales bacterium]HQP03823.1 phospho-N-acetylmuramoyl-pentapeptide-transferase [Bacteroidales bacterium]